MYRARTLALVLGLWLAGGCEGRCTSTPPAPAEPAAQQEVVDTAKNLEAAVQQCSEGLREAQNLVARAGHLREDLATLATVFEAQGILASIPLEVQTSEAKKQIRDTLAKLGLSSPRVQPEYHEVREQSALPKYYRDSPPYPYLSAELEETIRVQVDLPAADVDQLSGAVEALLKSEPRLFHLTPVTRHEDLFRLHVEIFRFRQVSPPVQSFDPPSMKKTLREMGLPQSGPECGAKPKCQALMRKLEGLIEEVKLLGAKAELSLRLEAELDLWKARRALFDKHVQEIRDLSARELLSGVLPAP